MLVRTDKEGLYRDTETRAVVNKDQSALSAYKTQRNKAREFADMKTKMEERDRKLDAIEAEIDNIKNILSTLLERFDDRSNS